MSEKTRGWDSCPQGELSRLAADLTFRRRVKAAAAAGVFLLAAAGVAGAGWLAHAALSPQPADPSCSPCSDAPAPCEGQPAQP